MGVASTLVAEGPTAVTVGVSVGSATTSEPVTDAVFPGSTAVAVPLPVDGVVVGSTKTAVPVGVASEVNGLWPSVATVVPLNSPAVVTPVPVGADVISTEVGSTVVGVDVGPVGSAVIIEVSDPPVGVGVASVGIEVLVPVGMESTGVEVGSTVTGVEVALDPGSVDVGRISVIRDEIVSVPLATGVEVVEASTGVVVETPASTGEEVGVVSGAAVVLGLGSKRVVKSEPSGSTTVEDGAALEVAGSVSETTASGVEVDAATGVVVVSDTTPVGAITTIGEVVVGSAEGVVDTTSGDVVATGVVAAAAVVGVVVSEPPMVTVSERTTVTTASGVVVGVGSVVVV